MLKVDRPREEWEQQCKEPLPCRLIEDLDELQAAVNRGARVPNDLMGTGVKKFSDTTLGKEVIAELEVKRFTPSDIMGTVFKDK